MLDKNEKRFCLLRVSFEVRSTAGTQKPWTSYLFQYDAYMQASFHF